MLSDHFNIVGFTPVSTNTGSATDHLACKLGKMPNLHAKWLVADPKGSREKSSTRAAQYLSVSPPASDEPIFYFPKHK